MHWSSAADAPLTALRVTFFMADLHTAMLRIDGERWREERRDSLRWRNECDKLQRGESGREATLGGQEGAEHTCMFVGVEGGGGGSLGGHEGGVMSVSGGAANVVSWHDQR